MKNCDFSISPFLACIDVRDLQCSQRNESVQSQLVFLSTTNSSRVLATNFREFFEKKQYLMNTLYLFDIWQYNFFTDK